MLDRAAYRNATANVRVQARIKHAGSQRNVHLGEYSLAKYTVFRVVGLER